MLMWLSRHWKFAISQLSVHYYYYYYCLCGTKLPTRVNYMETVARLLKTTKSNVCLYTSFIISQIVKCNTIICIHHKYIIYTMKTVVT